MVEATETTITENPIKKNYFSKKNLIVIVLAIAIISMVAFAFTLTKTSTPKPTISDPTPAI